MVFQLENLLPLPLETADVTASQVWKKNATLDSGRRIRIQASSGRGKSTLIHILYGRRKDYTGRATLDGSDISRFSADRWAALRQENLSIVFQELMLFPDLSGWENIELKNRLTKNKTGEEIRNMAECINAAHLFDKKCGIMSFGERQRIAILRALVQPFAWLLLDEPFSHLDEGNARLASALIDAECKKRNAGMLLTALDGDTFFNYDEIISV